MLHVCRKLVKLGCVHMHETVAICSPLTLALAISCCAVLCCAVLYCAVLCCAVLCCAVRCCALPCPDSHCPSAVQSTGKALVTEHDPRMDPFN